MLPVPTLASEDTVGGSTPAVDEMDTVYEQLEVWSRDRQAHRIWALEAKRAVEYLEGIQWTEEDRRALEEQKRPALVFNRISPLFRLIQGFFRQNRADIRYLPGADVASNTEIAEALTHTVKQIDEVTQAKWGEAEVFKDGMAAGRGYKDIRLDYERNALGQVEQKPLDPFSVYLDCDADEYDIAEHNHVTVNRYMSLNQVAMLYGGAQAKDLFDRIGDRRAIMSADMVIGDSDEIAPQRFFGLEDYLRDVPEQWHHFGGALRGTYPMEHLDRARKLLRVLDRQHRQLKRCRYAVDVDTGDKVVLPDQWDDDRVRMMLQQMQGRNYRVTILPGVRWAWRWTVTCMDKVLWDDWSPYETPTIIGFFPYFRRGVTPSFCRDLIDPQNEVNKRRSALIHAIMVSANPGWVYEEGSLDPESEDALEDHGGAPGLNLRYRQGREAPKRIQPGVPPQGLRLLDQEAQNDLKEISGVNDSALGNVDRVQSGRAIEARQRQAIISHEVAFDNMARFRELRGRKLLEIVQTYYTTERLVRTLGDDGQMQERAINRRMAADRIVNDLTTGRYLVAIDEAPASSTFLQAQFEEGMELVKAGVMPMQIAADVLVDLSTMPRKEEIKRRIAMAQQAAMGMPPGGPGGVPPGGPMPGARPGPPGRGGPSLPGPGGPPASGMVPPQPRPMPNAPMPRPMPPRPPGAPPVQAGPMGAPMRRPMPR